jgi:hypothetical protein
MERIEIIFQRKAYRNHWNAHAIQILLPII